MVVIYKPIKVVQNPINKRLLEAFSPYSVTPLAKNYRSRHMPRPTKSFQKTQSLRNKTKGLQELIGLTSSINYDKPSSSITMGW